MRLWLFAIAALILLMTIVGGATRLTESGLSITQWKPIAGVVPPLSDADWQAEFDGYKQIPQFKVMRPDMALPEFKTIFWWEWAHRLLARIIGLAFIVPALAFWIGGRLKGETGRWVLLACGFLALEPIVGWWMVSSGLSERVEVAPQRLAVHLLIAAAVYAALLAAAAMPGDAVSDRVAATAAPLTKGGADAPYAIRDRVYRRLGALLALLVFAQLGLGALAAGLRAGLIDNTWPLMEGALIPGSAFPGPSPLAAMAQDPTTAQFDHRMMAYLIAAVALALAVRALAADGMDAGKRRRALTVAALALVQGVLGVATLLLRVPIALGLAHQALAMALLGAAVWNWRRG